MTFLPFSKRLNMSPLIVNNVLVKLFMVRNILCATVQTYSTYTTIITTTTSRSLFLSAFNLFASKPVRYPF